VARPTVVGAASPSTSTQPLPRSNRGRPITVTIVVYDLPGRDCAALASNGELPLSQAGLARHKAEYIDAIAAVAAAPRYADVHIVAVIEPDGLPNLVTNVGDPECAQANSTGIYAQGVEYALDRLHAVPNVYTYLDMAHSGWLGWDDNLSRTVQLYTSIANATNAGKSSVDGIVTNVANYTPVAEPYLPDPALPVGGQPIKSGTFYQWNANFDESDFTAAVYTAFTAGNGWPSGLACSSPPRARLGRPQPARRPEHELQPGHLRQ
jgi:cellulose 1,4-beta-cellobiosidase